MSVALTRDKPRRLWLGGRVVTVLGWLCVVLSAALSVPQLVRLIRTGTSAGVSLLNWQLVAGSGVAWTVYGFANARVPIWVTNLFMCVGSLLIVRMVCRDRQQSLVKALLIPLAVIAVALGLYFVTSAAIFGFVVNAPQMVGVVAQIRDIVRDPDIGGFSPGYMALLWVVQLLWLTWAWFTGDMAIRVGASAMGLLTSAALIAYALRRAHVLGPKPDAG